MRKRIKNLVASKPYFCVYCFFFAWMLCTTVTEMIWDSSVYALLISIKVIPAGYLCVPPILSAAVVFEVIKILGFGSALFAWAEAAMKKSILGLKYSTFLPKEFRYAKWILNMHFVATVACIMLSAAGASEGAAVSLLLVYMGFIYLWVIIDNFLLAPETRMNEAKKKWKEDIEITLKNKDGKEAWNYLQILLKELGKAEVQHEDALIECIADAIIALTKTCDTKDQKSTRHCIDQLCGLWETLTTMPQYKQSVLLQRIVYEFLKYEHITCDSLALVGCSYVLYLFQHYVNSSGDGQADTLEKCMLQVSNALFSLTFGLNGQCRNGQLNKFNEMIKYAKATYMALVWMLFISGRIALSRELIMKAERDAGDKKEMIFSVLCSAFMMDEQNVSYDIFVNQFCTTCDKFGWNQAEGGINNAGAETILE